MNAKASEGVANGITGEYNPVFNKEAGGLC